MGTTTIYRINETDRTINIAQSVNDTDESLHGAVLNTRMYTFDELMNQHKVSANIPSLMTLSRTGSTAPCVLTRALKSAPMI